MKSTYILFSETLNEKYNFLIVLLFVLLLGKAVASALSGSLAIISSLLDSCVDLASGGIMWFAARQMRKRKPYKYPEVNSAHFKHLSTYNFSATKFGNLLAFSFFEWCFIHRY
ncbi:unnamed protein product [Schistosoma mattheei]|uniref:Cation efflux protein transmembrane domain-containing protein n=1 Tax=Schistosoma mattheei TaxID=31246 RepID=A0A183NPW3_9TREM|nr:unnamed protein product [Schistosoma mattheei]